MNPFSGFKGEMKIQVLQDGIVVEDRPWQPNLITDRGLDSLASMPIPDIFLYAVKGEGDGLAMSELLTGTSTLSAVSGGGATGTLTSTGRNYTADDVGKLGRAPTTGSNFVQFMITSWAGAGTPKVVGVHSVGQTILAAFTSKVVTLFRVGVNGMTEAADSRTNDYSGIPGDNYSSDALNVRTYQRAFLFEPEPENSTDRTATGGFTWTGTALTKGTGGTAFSTADIGCYVELSGEYAKIIAISTAGNSSATLDASPSATITAATPLTVYGFNSYSQIGFSDLEADGDNLNVNIRLQTDNSTPVPVLALGANPVTVTGQQIKVTYRLAVTFTPFDKTGSISSGIVDTSPIVMNANKNGEAVIENLIASSIASDGSTDTTQSGLDPYLGGYMALSRVSTALQKLSNSANPPDRSAGAEYVALTAGNYTDGSRTLIKSGTFAPNEGIALPGSGWRTLGIYDPDTNLFVFSFLFANAQTKPGTHALTIRFRSTWDRDLS